MSDRQNESILVAAPVKTRRLGTLYLEGRLRDGTLSQSSLDCGLYARVLEAQLLSAVNTFDMLEDILADERNGNLKLGSEYPRAKQILDSLKVVERIGPATEETCFSSLEVKLRVQVFELWTASSPLEESDEGDEQLGELISMPHTRFEAVWDELVFDHDIKADLIWMMTNILRFSQALKASNFRRKLNPLILLYGPPGTGKTSLCQGLAQKISIRLSEQYESTTLIQIKTATLLSKYFSESARHVDEIFTKISHMCQEGPENFICVLIDEVESIASSREFSTKEGESHDSLRATNALLTGLDRSMSFPNVVFLFTSNMCDVLEPAFLDRCGLKEYVGPPSVAAQYEILRSILQNLISSNVVKSTEEIPSYDDAEYQAVANLGNSGPKLLDLVKLIRSTNESLDTEISGRSLAQLPEKALMRYLRDEDCDVDTLMGFMERSVLEGVKKTGISKDEKQDKGGKRTWATFLEEECDFSRFVDLVESYRAGVERQARLKGPVQSESEAYSGNQIQATGQAPAERAPE
ncbi:uncharacterized protein L3040_008929 [Drepanopeziza brunnea f. sp. 'multigermtubi']|uniref:uncharacterized protein n=1 Tax=Drepanopeziza brunnea f. sp. 'multigermtubi' TaxID=698441 RepID=UPI0023A67079|nr:hypothetical protein L3040_008929 [Drepanopeziza brunnea f. sp. 'multigermtubi']